MTTRRLTSSNGPPLPSTEYRYRAHHIKQKHPAPPHIQSPKSKVQTRRSHQQTPSAGPAFDTRKLFHARTIMPKSRTTYSSCTYLYLPYCTVQFLQHDGKARIARADSAEHTTEPHRSRLDCHPSIHDIHPCHASQNLKTIIPQMQKRSSLCLQVPC
ncbi:hypothetical protein EYC84_003423 [Monilinia fructicola]|uniref:Uncharacterized protein n=1 Tax=Monilinia fructicola TaxID=38448 RepID=A0A5M9JWL0_MONFR|nr:hypothetical protein EYC84_003423 [Monilinia fructicola]